MVGGVFSILVADITLSATWVLSVSARRVDYYMKKGLIVLMSLLPYADRDYFLRKGVNRRLAAGFNCDAA
jgi:hypothetical protein